MSRRRPQSLTPADLPQHLLPVVAVVGRPNVGKSTLFNRLTGTKRAAVFDTPGVTRDRNYGSAEWGGRVFRLIDTGGFESDLDRMPLLQEMREQALMAIQEADVVVFMTDIVETNNPTDLELTKILRKGDKPMVLAVNKCEKQDQILEAYEFARLGVGEVFPMSALHGNGTAEMLEAMLDLLPEEHPDIAPYWETPDDWDDDENADETRWEKEAKMLASRPIRLAIVGRQNVGKSTLVNQLLGHERVIASELAGTTRDAIDSPLRALERDWTLVDTAGIRRRGKVGREIEGLAAMSSMFSMERADVAALLIDATTGLTSQDKHIAEYAVERGCCLIIGVNKWDAVEKDHRTADEFTKKLHDEMPFLTYPPILYLSAKTGQRAEKILRLALDVYTEACRRIDTPALNDWVAEATGKFTPPIRRNRKLTIKYITQTGVLPPTFALFCNDPKIAHFSYQRYLSNSLREKFGFEQVPIKVMLKKKSKK